LVPVRLLTAISVKGSSNEGFAQHGAVIFQLALTRLAQLGTSVAALTLLVCWPLQFSGYLSHFLYFFGILCIVQCRFYFMVNHLISP